MKAAAVKETIFAGGLIFTRKIQKRAIRPGETKTPKASPTPAQVEEANKRRSIWTMLIKLQHNFFPGDYHLVLTYSGQEPSVEQAKEDITRCKRQFRQAYRKHGLPFRWIQVTEYENHRIHHHIVINAGVSITELNEIWGKGTVHVRMLRKDRDWRKLAEYLIKETDKTFRSPDAVSKMRYSCSRNLTMPEVFEEPISLVELGEEPKPVKGYYIDMDTYFKGENPVTERPYMEYIMLPVNPYKTRKRLNGVNKKKYRNESHDQWLKRNMPLQYEMELD